MPVVSALSSEPNPDHKIHVARAQETEPGLGGPELRQ